MASFVVKQVIGSKLTEMKGGLDKFTGEGANEQKTESGEDPEVTQARLEAEQRRQEKHRKMEQEREKMRKEIRDKYNIQKKEPVVGLPNIDGRIATGEHNAARNAIQELEDEDSKKIVSAALRKIQMSRFQGLMSQVNGLLGKAKTTVTEFANNVKNYLPFNN